MVGSTARMRRSSVTTASARGTLKSARRRTRLPARLGRSSSTGTLTLNVALRLVGGADDLHDLGQPVRVAPLVVVPAEHLDQVADDLRERKSTRLNSSTSRSRMPSSA